MPSLPPLVAVIGPTGSGKTALAAFLAERFDGEIVSADAKQVFRRMDIGTAKEKNLPVPQHLIDIKEPGEKITVGEYQKLAYAEIDRLREAGKLPILAGGSSLYAEAVINGYVFHPLGKSRSQEPRYAVLKVGVAVERQELKRRLRERTLQWMEAGLAEEISSLLHDGVPVEWLRWCGQEYRYFTDYVLGHISKEDAVRLTDISLDQFVKRQYTWWRRHPDVQWVKDREEAAGLVEGFLAGAF